MDRGPVECALDCPATPRVAAAIGGGASLSLAPVAEPARPFLAALLARKLSQPVLVIDGLKSQEAYELSLIAFGAAPQFYPAWESPPHSGQLPSADVIADRLRVLRSLLHHSTTPSLHPPIIVASVQAL